MQTHKQQAAAKTTAIVQKAQHDIIKTLSRSTTTDGDGIYTDPYRIERQLREAKALIDEALQLVKATEWPGQ